MASNPFTDYPEYLLAYTGTGTYDGWAETLEKVFETVMRKTDIAVARERIAKMTMYWCVEIGQSYKAPLVYHKFSKCYTWEDFNQSFIDPWLKDEWKARRDAWKAIEARRAELARIPGVAPQNVLQDPYSRDILMALTEQCTFHHGAETARNNQGLFCNLISIYGWQALSRLTDSPVRTKPWLSPIRDRDNIPNLLNTFWIEKYLNDTYGDDLIRFKQFYLDSRKEEASWLTTAAVAANTPRCSTNAQESSSQPTSESISSTNTSDGVKTCPRKSKKRSESSKPNSEEKLFCAECGDEIFWSGRGRKPVICKKDECKKSRMRKYAKAHREKNKS